MPRTGENQDLAHCLGGKARCPAGFLHGRSIGFPHTSLNLVRQMNHRDSLGFSLLAQPCHCHAVLQKYLVVPSCPRPEAARWSRYKSDLPLYWWVEVLSPHVVLQGAAPHLQATFILQHLSLMLYPFQGPDLLSWKATSLLTLHKLLSSGCKAGSKSNLVCWQLNSMLEEQVA